jgi:uncharacterized caspase-like protein
LLALLGVAALLSAPASARTVRTLFVGINDYAPEVDADLKGAVNDVRLMRTQLSEGFGLKLGPMPTPAACESATPVSITLVDGCATRKAILDRFDRLVRASAPGDTLLFYFAGHGVYEPSIRNVAGDQASGQNSTIVAADSRKPMGDSFVDDIRDTVLRARIDEAQAHGVQVVTIFDSCNSGTATRSAFVATRSIAPAAGETAAAGGEAGWAPRRPPPGAAAAKAERIHLAAAKDRQEAKESGDGENRHGVFTRALVSAMAARRANGIPFTYADLLIDVRKALATDPSLNQVPVGEGPLATTAFLQPTTHGLGRRMPALVQADHVKLFDGTLSGVAAGSVFALYADPATALAGKGELGLARVLSVEAQTARLESLPGLAAGRQLTAVERVRAWGPLEVPVLFRGLKPPEVAEATKGLDLVKPAASAPRYIVERKAGKLLLLDAGEHQLVDISAVRAASDGERMNEVLRRVANAEALLALPRRADGPLGSLEVTAEGCADCRVEAAGTDGAPAVVRAGDRFRLRVSKAEAAGEGPVYPYLFEVTPQFGINRLFPPGGANEEVAGSFHVGNAVRAARPGDFRLVLILSRKPLGTGPLEQGSLPRSGGCADGDALSLLLCSASRGSRAAAARPAGEFDVVVMPVRIEKEAT